MSTLSPYSAEVGTPARVVISGSAKKALTNREWVSMSKARAGALLTDGGDRRLRKPSS